MSYLEIYNKWLTHEFFDEKTREELAALSGDENEIKERFYKTLEFGTAGLRGIIGAGTNRMNIYTVRKATQGFANYILKQEPGDSELGVAISFDCRRMSREFAREAALVFCANDIKAYIFEDLRPTPELSFAVRKLNLIAGVMITASHNPREYNGYKAYWSDGSQIPFPRDEEIIKEVEAVPDFWDIKTMPLDEAESAGLYNVIGPDIDEAYMDCVKAQRVHPDISGRDELRVVYTPLNGAGNIPVRRALSDCGYENVFVVSEQELPDPDFTTVGYPNPEDPKAFALAMKLAAAKDADLIIGTDPDADRLGVAVKDPTGEYIVLSGNMIGTLLTEYILRERSGKNELPENGAVISTIVSTKLTKEIAENYGVAYFDVLTGFKHICGKVRELERQSSHEFILGFEESNGFLSGPYCRDKDAVSATLLVCEAAAFYKHRGLTLYGALIEMYEKYGYYKETGDSVVMPGADGIAKMTEMMEGLRANPAKIINGKKVTRLSDFMTQKIKDYELDVFYNTGLPVSDVLLYTLSDESWFCVRPSGTEPKVKIYYGVKGETFEDAIEKAEKLRQAVRPLVADSD